MLTLRKKNLLMTVILVIGITMVAFGAVMVAPNLISTLGISSYAATKIIDIVATAGSVYSIIGIVAAVIGSAGFGVALLVTARSLIKTYGKQFAKAW